MEAVTFMPEAASRFASFEPSPKTYWHWFRLAWLSTTPLEESPPDHAAIA
jgi:hypothetical protein